jgi:RHH-type transcriptional regulator, rel operon repressor / antitoxin RelB
MMMHTELKPSSRTINVRVPEAIFQKLDALANATARTKSYVTIEALSQYVESQSWQVSDIQAGIAEADAGEFATAEEVATVFAKYGA